MGRARSLAPRARPIPDGLALELFDGSRWSPVKSSLAIGTGTPLRRNLGSRLPEGKDLLIERQRRRRAG